MDEKPFYYQFDDVLVEPQTFKVWKAGQPLPLEPKAFEVLVFLLRHRERMVEKNELLEAVWGETFVTPNALTRVVAHLRKLLGDDPKEARYIETVPTRGYRFIAEVQMVDAGQKNLNGSSWVESTVSTHQRSAIFPLAAPRHWSVSRYLQPLSIGLLLLLVIFLLWKQPRAAEQAGVLRTTQLTTTPGLDLFPAFSPDGSVIVYSSLRQGNFELFARPLAPGSKELQLTADGAQNLQPKWSPDGKLIAYHSRNRRGIWLIPALGGVTRQLTEFGAHPVWSPDGEWIAFQSDTPSDINQAAFAAMPPSTLWIVSARGGAPKQITTIGTPPGGHGAPTWAPNGRRIVFVTYDLGLSEIWSVTPQGQDLRCVWKSAGIIYDPVHSPDGQYLFFSMASGNFRLWRLRLDANTGSAVGKPSEIANTGPALARHLTIAANGKQLAYSSLTLTDNIGSVSLDPVSSTAQGEPKLLTQDTSYRKNNHVFSPDGKSIAFNVWRMGADGEVWLIDAQGNQPRQLTAEPAALLGWLPQSQQALLVSRNNAGTRLLKVDVSSGQQTTLGAYNTEVRMGRLSPDGQSVAFNSRASGALNVWTIALAGGPPKQLTFDRELLGFACWAPDSRMLAVEMKRGEDCHIAVIPRDGGALEQLTFDRGQSWPGSWSPDGDKIVFAGLRDGLWNIWWVARRSKAQKQLTHYTTPNSYVRYPAWSPSGNQIVYEYGETFGNVWLLELK